MSALIWPIMLAGQVAGIVIVLGGWKTRPQWVSIVVGICLTIMLLTFFGLSSANDELEAKLDRGEATSNYIN